MMAYPGTMRPGMTPENIPFQDLPGLDIFDKDPVPWPHFQHLDWHHRWSEPPHEHAIPMEDFIEQQGRWATPEMEAQMRAGVRQDVRMRQEALEEAQTRSTVVVDDDDDEVDRADYNVRDPIALGDGVFGKLGSDADRALTAAAVSPDNKMRNQETIEDDDEEEDDEEDLDDDFDSLFMDLGLDLEEDDEEEEEEDEKDARNAVGGAKKKVVKDKRDMDDEADLVLDLGMALGFDEEDEDGDTPAPTSGGSMTLRRGRGTTATINVDEDDDLDLGLDDDEDDMVDGVDTVPLDDFGDADNLDTEDFFDEGGFDFDDNDYDGGGDMW
jgi:hypothetical protein